MIGFVYLWYDRHRKLYYLGSHFGQEDDGYIGGGKWFRKAHNKRPNDFKRRILERIYEGGLKEVRAAEDRWFRFVKVEEIGTRYYNLKLSAVGFDSYLGSKMGNLVHSEKDELGRSKLAVRRAAIVHKVKDERGKSLHSSIIGKLGGAVRAPFMPALAALGAKAAHAVKDEQGRSVNGVRWAARTHAAKDEFGRSVVAVRAANSLHNLRDENGLSIKASEAALRRWSRDTDWHWWYTPAGKTYLAGEPRSLEDLPGRPFTLSQLAENSGKVWWCQPDGTVYKAKTARSVADARGRKPRGRVYLYDRTRVRLDA